MRVRCFHCVPSRVPAPKIIRTTDAKPTPLSRPHFAAAGWAVLASSFASYCESFGEKIRSAAEAGSNLKKTARRKAAFNALEKSRNWRALLLLIGRGDGGGG